MPLLPGDSKRRGGLPSDELLDRGVSRLLLEFMLLTLVRELLLYVLAIRRSGRMLLSATRVVTVSLVNTFSPICAGVKLPLGEISGGLALFIGYVGEVGDFV